MKICFQTVCSNKYEPAYQKMQSSLKKFHPDIPLIKFGQDQLNKEIEKTRLPLIASGQAYFISHLLESYDMVIHIDSDIVVCSPLVEVFEGKYDVATINHYIENKEHNTINAGFFSVTSKEFSKEYFDRTKRDAMNYNDGEQGVLKQILKEGKYSHKHLETDISTYATENSINLLQLYVSNDKLMYKGKEVRIIHVIGRLGTKLKMLDFEGKVNTDVLEYINRLCKT
jgi:hypothetical protein